MKSEIKVQMKTAIKVQREKGNKNKKKTWKNSKDHDVKSWSKNVYSLHCKFFSHKKYGESPCRKVYPIISM